MNNRFTSTSKMMHSYKARDSECSYWLQKQPVPHCLAHLAWPSVNIASCYMLRGCCVVCFMTSEGLCAEMSKTVALPPPNVKIPKMHYFFLLKTRYYYAITKQELLEFVLLFYEAKYLQSLRLILCSLNSDSRKMWYTHLLSSHFPFRAGRARLFITTSSFRNLNIYLKMDNIWTHQLTGGRVNVPFNFKNELVQFFPPK